MLQWVSGGKRGLLEKGQNCVHRCTHPWRQDTEKSPAKSQTMALNCWARRRRRESRGFLHRLWECERRQLPRDILLGFTVLGKSGRV